MLLTFLDAIKPGLPGNAAAKLPAQFSTAQPASLYILDPGQQHCVPSTPLQQHVIHGDRRLRAPQGKQEGHGTALWDTAGRPATG